MNNTQYRHTHHGSHSGNHCSSHSRRRRREARRAALKMGTGVFFLALLLLFLYCGVFNYPIWQPLMIAVMLLMAVVGVVVGVGTYFMVRRRQHRSDA